jgi:hypothetical protein
VNIALNLLERLVESKVVSPGVFPLEKRLGFFVILDGIERAKRHLFEVDQQAHRLKRRRRTETKYFMTNGRSAVLYSTISFRGRDKQAMRRNARR